MVNRFICRNENCTTNFFRCKRVLRNNTVLILFVLGLLCLILQNPNSFVINNEKKENLATSELTESFAVDWIRNWRPSTYTWAYGGGVAINSSENILVAGWNRLWDPDFYDGEVFLLNYDVSGNLIWAKSWREEDSYIVISEMVIDSNDNIYFAGTWSFSNFVGRDFCLIKFNSKGELLWKKNYGINPADDLSGLAIDGLDNLYLIGQTRNTSPIEDDIMLMKIDSNGNKLWHRTWGGEGDDNGDDICADLNNNIYVIGDLKVNGTTELCILKYDTSGNLLNSTIYQDDYSYGGLIETDLSNNVVITGSRNGTPFVAKFNSSGNLIWNTQINYSYAGSRITFDSSNNFYIGGSITRIIGRHYTEDFHVIKFDNLGNLVSNYTWDIDVFDHCRGLALDSNGNLFLAGYGYDDISLIKYGNDTDSDLLSDIQESYYSTDRFNPDTDGDGILDGIEIYKYNTDALNPDTDGDLLTDYEEIFVYLTDPLNPDTDGDGFSDYEEILEGYDPNDPQSNSFVSLVLIIITIIISLSALAGFTFVTLRIRKAKKLKLERKEDIENEIRVELKLINSLIDTNKLDNAYQKLLDIKDISIKQNFFELNKNIQNLITEIYPEVMKTKIELVRNQIFKATTSFSRLHLDEISEMVNIKDKNLIENVIIEMIEKQEIKATYFKSSNYVIFEIGENF